MKLSLCILFMITVLKSTLKEEKSESNPVLIEDKTSIVDITKFYLKLYDHLKMKIDIYLSKVKDRVIFGYLCSKLNNKAIYEKVKDAYVSKPFGTVYVAFITLIECDLEKKVLFDVSFSLDYFRYCIYNNHFQPYKLDCQGQPITNRNMFITQYGARCIMGMQQCTSKEEFKKTIFCAKFNLLENDPLEKNPEISKKSKNFLIITKSIFFDIDIKVIQKLIDLNVSEKFYVICISDNEKTESEEENIAKEGITKEEVKCFKIKYSDVCREEKSTSTNLCSTNMPQLNVIYLSCSIENLCTKEYDSQRIHLLYLFMNLNKNNKSSFFSLDSIFYSFNFSCEPSKNNQGCILHSFKFTMIRGKCNNEIIFIYNKDGNLEKKAYTERCQNHHTNESTITLDGFSLNDFLLQLFALKKHPGKIFYTCDYYWINLGVGYGLSIDSLHFYQKNEGSREKSDNAFYDFLDKLKENIKKFSAGKNMSLKIFNITNKTSHEILNHIKHSLKRLDYVPCNPQLNGIEFYIKYFGEISYYQ